MTCKKANTSYNSKPCIGAKWHRRLCPKADCCRYVRMSSNHTPVLCTLLEKSSENLWQCSGRLVVHLLNWTAYQSMSSDLQALHLNLHVKRRIKLQVFVFCWQHIDWQELYPRMNDPYNPPIQRYQLAKTQSTSRKRAETFIRVELLCMLKAAGVWDDTFIW